MHGTGPPLVTPFDQAGALDTERLEELVGWLEDRGVDFLVPCGSTGEAELMRMDERSTVIQTVADAATVPIIAGTGHPGFHATVEQTQQASDAGADAALIVTPFYYPHDPPDLITYYEDVAAAVDLPVILYNVPKFTGVTLAPDTVAALVEHDNIIGMKDSAGDLSAFQRTRQRVPPSFSLFTGSGGVYGPALDAGADGGILALANIAPERTTEIYEYHQRGDDQAAREITRDLVELNHAITTEYGIPGLKAAMRHRGAPAGYPRRPHQPADETRITALEPLAATAEP